MTRRSEIELELDRYLADGSERAPERVIDAALDEIDHTHQRRALRVPWRFHHMPTFAKPALAGAAAVAVLVVGVMFLNRGPTDSVGAQSIATPSPLASAPASASPSPSPTSALTDTSNWTPFASKLYGYEMAHPTTWYAEPATQDWSLEADGSDWIGYGVADRYRGPSDTQDTLVTAIADEVPSGTSEEEWIAEYAEGIAQAAETCDGSTANLEPISVDGHAGTMRIDECGEAQAFVFREDRVHVFAIWRAEVPLLEAFLSTVEFQQ